tara:strand:- start:20471 stop:21010 length:540 start_codon:yes stop_codon:yes gene_type:complete
MIKNKKAMSAGLKEYMKALADKEVYGKAIDDVIEQNSSDLRISPRPPYVDFLRDVNQYLVSDIGPMPNIPNPLGLGTGLIQKLANKSIDAAGQFGRDLYDYNNPIDERSEFFRDTVHSMPVNYKLTNMRPGSEINDPNYDIFTPLDETTRLMLLAKKKREAMEKARRKGGIQSGNGMYE